MLDQLFGSGSCLNRNFIGVYLLLEIVKFAVQRLFKKYEFPIFQITGIKRQHIRMQRINKMAFKTIF